MEKGVQGQRSCCGDCAFELPSNSPKHQGAKQGQLFQSLAVSISWRDTYPHAHAVPSPAWVAPHTPPPPPPSPLRGQVNGENLFCWAWPGFPCVCGMACFPGMRGWCLSSSPCTPALPRPSSLHGGSIGAGYPQPCPARSTGFLALVPQTRGVVTAKEI